MKRQLDRKVKVVRSDRGGEYYRKFNESGQCKGLFRKLLESRGMCTQYTMFDTPQQNGVAVSQNRTLMKMVRSMVNYNVPLSLRMYALKSVAYLLNRVLSKAIPKTSYELWTRRKPRGCSIEVRVYNSHEKKLDVITISGFFVSYPDKSKRYTFYCPNHITRIVESSNVRFIENGQISSSEESQKRWILKRNRQKYLHLMFLLKLLFLLLYHGHTTFQCNKSIFQIHRMNI